jgi:hypothetical protein
MRYCAGFFMGNSLLLGEDLLIPFLVSELEQLKSRVLNLYADSAE